MSATQGMTPVPVRSSRQARARLLPPTGLEAVRA